MNEKEETVRKETVHSWQKVLAGGTGLLLGFVLAVGFLFALTLATKTNSIVSPLALVGQRQVIGFLPYWLLDRAKKDYSPQLTMLAYFALRVGPDGSIVKLNSPQEEEPGWYALKSGNVTPFLQNARDHGIRLSLVIDSGSTTTIDRLLDDPVQSAKNLLSDTLPLLHTYHFSDLNLDIEYVSDASMGARLRFTQFVTNVRKLLPKDITLSAEISPTDALTPKLIDTAAVGKIADNMILMAYDYHAPDSYVTGPIAPLSGALAQSEYDVHTAVEQSLTKIAPQKVILGIPLYGYEWEVLNPWPRSAVIPGSGVAASSSRVEKFLSQCATCSAKVDTVAKETYLTYYSADTNTNHLIFFPTADSLKAKLQLASDNGLGGVALWALGYEDSSLLTPLTTYK